jgi:hypothetical protein
MTKSKKEAAPEIPVHVLKTNHCPTLSGKSTLTYQIGRVEKGEPLLRLFSNPGGGFFSPEWLALSVIQKALDKAAGKPFTSQALRPLYHGKSANNHGFLAAVLLSLQLVKRYEDKARHFLKTDGKAFAEEVKTFLSGPMTAETAKAQKAVDKAKPGKQTAKKTTKPK